MLCVCEREREKLGHTMKYIPSLLWSTVKKIEKYLFALLPVVLPVTSQSRQ